MKKHITYKLVIEKLKNIESKERYNTEQDILKKYMNKEKYLYSEFEYVYMISTLINSFYSTRMGADRLYAVAEYISKNTNINNLDKVITVINNARGNLQYKNNNFGAYSFLTKYYSVHDRYLSNTNSSNYPIFDSAVEKCLKNIIENKKQYSTKFQDYLNKFHKKDLRDYRKFNELIENFLAEINSNASEKSLTKTELDKYFWTVGRE